MVCRIFVLSVIVVLMISCRKESPYASLSGNVYYEGIAIPIRDVRIKVDQNTAYSGSEGYYEIPKIRKGIYMLRAEKEDFDPFYQEMKFLKDQVFQNIQMVSETYTSKVYGEAYGDYSGEARVGLRCVIMNPNGTESRLEATTDSSGYYEISMVPEGYHQLKVYDDIDLVIQKGLEVGADDVNYDIVLSDVFSFKDSRDGREYSALKIDSLDWMTENLAFLPYVNDPLEVSDDKRQYYVYAFEGTDPEQAIANDNFNKYGVLYNWKAAISACPEGWRLPTDDDWKSLEKFLGMDRSELEMDNWRNSESIGVKLKDSLGWELGGSGDNSSWFNALPGGYIGYNGGSFGEGSTGNFWTSDKCGDQHAWYRSMKADERGVLRSCSYLRIGCSVRCVR